MEVEYRYESFYRHSESGHSSIHNTLMDSSKYSRSAKTQQRVLYKNA